LPRRRQVGSWEARCEDLVTPPRTICFLIATKDLYLSQKAQNYALSLLRSHTRKSNEGTYYV
jgi:hypothetical protein